MAAPAFATSADALAAGVGMAVAVKSFGEAVLSVFCVGTVTFSVCFFGVKIGHRFGSEYSFRAAVFGGSVLVLMEIKILFEHLGFLNFI